MTTIENVQDTLVTALRGLLYEEQTVPPQGRPALTGVDAGGEGVKVTFADGGQALLAIIMGAAPDETEGGQ